jgi:hypothetical protein
MWSDWDKKEENWNKKQAISYTEDIKNTSDKIKNTQEFESCMKQQSNACIQSTGMQIAQKTKDAAFCNELSTPEQKSSCEFTINLVNAMEKKDIKICDKINDANYQRECKIQLFKQEATEKKDISICDKIDTLVKSTNTGSALDTFAQKDQCIIWYIMNHSWNESDCEKILDESSLALCKINIKNKKESLKISQEETNTTSIKK